MTSRFLHINVLEYSYTAGGQETVISYQYDAANQLTSATQNGATWHYTYDGNGSLVMASPGAAVSNGAKRYTYNVAGFLVKVENYITDWQPQAEMAYDGLGWTWARPSPSPQPPRRRSNGAH